MVAPAADVREVGLLACGMPLDDVVAAVTTTPRRILRMPEPWLGADGTVRHATVFRLAATADRTYRDAAGETRTPDRHVVPVATVVNGHMVPSPC